MSQKGVVKNGEAFCLECKSSVDREADRCPSCDSVLDEEVKAFSCPRCKTVLQLGTSECPQCGMRFRIKALRQKLAPWARQEESVDDEQAETREPSGEPAQVAQHKGVTEEGDAAKPISAEQLDKLRRLLDSMDKLGESRADLLSKIKHRDSDEKQRLAEMRGLDDALPRLDLVESEIIALADEIADIAELHSGMLSIADEISTLAESFDLSDEVRAKGLSAKAVKMVTEAGSADANQMMAREDQLAKREEMVDRKIRGYASKRKELEDREAAIVARTAELEKESVALERMREEPPVAAGESSEQMNQWKRAEAEISARVSSLCSALCDGQDGSISDADETIESRLTVVEDATRRLLSERGDAQARLKEIDEREVDMKRLLNALDQLLGQLPEDAIQRFTQSDDYKLYERMLDVYKI